jgi:hypothetical protein
MRSLVVWVLVGAGVGALAGMPFGGVYVAGGAGIGLAAGVGITLGLRGARS